MVNSQAFRNPTFVAGVTQAAGLPPGGLTIDPTTCTATNTSLIGFPIIAEIAKKTSHPPIIACAKNPAFPAPVGDIFVLDAAEQVQAKGIIDGYNNYIKSKADAIGFAYYDPNTTLARVAPLDAVLTSHVPNLASPTATFGTYISLDGVHPNAAAHIEIAKDLIAVINAKYGTKLAAP
jgi:lysophospholipase L1-like esterase